MEKQDMRQLVPLILERGDRIGGIALRATRWSGVERPIFVLSKGEDCPVRSILFPPRHLLPLSPLQGSLSPPREGRD